MGVLVRLAAAAWLAIDAPLHEPADGSASGFAAGRVAGDHSGVLPAAGELNLKGASPAGAQLHGEPGAAAVRGAAAFKAGRGARGGEPSDDLADADADYQVVGRGRHRGVQPADCRGAAAGQVPDAGPLAQRVRLRATQRNDDLVAVGQVDVGPLQRCQLAAAQGAVEHERDDRAVDQAAALGVFLPLDPAASAARVAAGGQDFTALLGGEFARQAAATCGGRASAEILERLLRQWTVRCPLAGAARGAANGGDHERGGGRRAAFSDNRLRCIPEP